ncbi:hypothetical protein [Pseudomonas sp. SBB6]|uniref:hypothetical protein n=1 Tax=Pseudomonas sp. SBB6 TaxID=2962032 RepID=UPI0020B7A73F|nr:hypothetical protein [Pseudomonas sp. SBB6]MCP3750750.1 hypothetical protein [Pseudomonas sp. SBB6]
MDKSDEIKLNLQVSRLSRLAIINLETVMRLTTAIESMPNAPDPVLLEARNSINEQIDLLREIFQLEADHAEQ